ncbi:MAG: GNAT family N-acetyltransferase [Limnochordia bacterium]|jgi:RimJ/RimL family protein N-acetyltransferase|nr:GNAT family N-acetyltransferase [Limnochordia bacterium]
MYLQDGNLVIRNATSDDAELLCLWWNDGKIMDHAGFPDGLGTTSQAIAEQLATDDDETHRRLILAVDSVPVGEMNYRNKGNKIAEIGIKICDFEKQEKGFGTRYLKMLIGTLLTEMGYEKVILDTNVKNTRAQHVYERLGFRTVGTRVDSWQDQHGVLQSSIDYELTYDDFVK